MTTACSHEQPGYARVITSWRLLLSCKALPRSCNVTWCMCFGFSNILCCVWCRNRRQDLHLITGSILPILPTVTQTRGCAFDCILPAHCDCLHTVTAVPIIHFSCVYLPAYGLMSHTCLGCMSSAASSSSMHAQCNSGSLKGANGTDHAFSARLLPERS